MSVDLKSKTWYLTYARPINPTTPKQRRAIANYPTWTLEALTEYVKSKGTIIGLIACKELHQDGDPHFHLLLVYDKPLRVKRIDYWDYKDVHPNNQTQIRNMLDVWNYVNKDGMEVIKDGTLIQPPAAKPKKWGEILQTATNSSEFMELARLHQPRDFILQYDKLQQTAVELFRPPATTYETPAGYQFHLPAALQNYLETEFVNADRPKTLVLVGPSRLGKTVWARSLGTHNYMNSLFSLDEFDESRDYLILDDIDFDYIPGRKAFFFAQNEFILTDKYRKKKKVRWGKPTLYLCNTEPDWEKSRDPYKDNVIIVNITGPLWEVAVEPPTPPPIVHRMFLRYHEDNNRI